MTAQVEEHAAKFVAMLDAAFQYLDHWRERP